MFVFVTLKFKVEMFVNVPVIHKNIRLVQSVYLFFIIVQKKRRKQMERMFKSLELL